MAGALITLTDAGRAALVNPEHTGTVVRTITEVGVTNAPFVPGAGLNALPNQLKRLSTISGENVAADTVHITIRDDSADQYQMYGFGLFLDNGVLLGTYSQDTPITEKSPVALLLLSADIQFTTIDAAALTFGDSTFTNPPATETRQGVIEIADQAEVDAGADDARAVTPKKLATRLTAALSLKEGTIAAGTASQYWRGDKTWRDFFTDVRAATLTGLSTATNAVIAATDTVLGALGKLQKQITDLGNSKENSIAAGTAAQFWRGDKTWQDLATSVRGTVLTGLSTATNAVIAATDTVLGALGKLQKQITDLDAAKVNTTDVIGATKGGTGQNGYAVGDMLFANTTTTLSKLAAVATGNVLISGGAGAAPSWGKVGLTTHVSGTLGTGNGGTNNTAAPTNGGVAYGDGAKITYTAAGASKQVLISNGAAAPSWQTLDMTYIPGATWKKSARVATTANLSVTATATTLTNSGALAALSIDGVALAAGERVLVKDQTTSAQNGIYDVTNAGSAAVAWILTRSADADSAAEIAAAVVGVDEGTSQGGDLWTTSFKTTGTLGTTSMFWYESLDSGNFTNYAEPAIAAGTASQYWRGDKTWRDFATDVRGAVLTGLSTATNAVIAAGDTVLAALGKLQKQITDLTTTVSGKEPTIAAGTASQYWRGDKTWQDLATAVRAVVLTGLSTATSTAVAATDTVLAAIGKIQAQLNLKAPLDSPPLTGNPTAPTPAQFDNDTSLSTTAFVQRALGNLQGYLLLGIGATTALTASQVGSLIIGQGGTANLPALSTVPIGGCFTFATGAATNIVCNGTDKIQFNGNPSDSVSSLSLNSTLTICSNGTAWIAVSGAATLAKSAEFFASKAGSGYQKLPSGLIIQWMPGTASKNGVAGILNSWPIQFPNSCSSVAAMHVGTDPAVNIVVSDYGTVGCYLLSNYAASSVSCIIFAIGY